MHDLANHYLMVTFDDFLGKRSEYHNLLWAKSGGQRYKLVTFEQMGTNPLKLQAAQNFVAGVPLTDKVKILLHGHGNAHLPHITNDAGTAQRDIAELTDLVCSLVGGGATNPNAAGRMVVEPLVA